MPYAKTSLRAEQAALREKMRTAGMSHRQIAVELARRYGLRPRSAWRHAYGWSLKEAAEQVNSHAGATGLDPGGRAGMTGPHLCEYENWPGHGPAPAGRRPTPLVLALLAAAYNAATIHDLLDLADYEHMPAGDRLILDKATPAGPHPRRSPAVCSPLAQQLPPGSPRPSGTETMAVAGWQDDPGASADGSGKGQTVLSGRAMAVVADGHATVSHSPVQGLRSTQADAWRMPAARHPAPTMPVLNLDEMQHMAMALENARRYADGAVVGYFERQLAVYAASDGARGPKETLPLVLAVIAAAGHAARDAKPAIRSELLAVGARSAEFAAWLYRDSAMTDIAGYWHDRTAEWAQIAGAQALQGYVLLKRSQVAWDARDAQRMLMLAQAVLEGPWALPARVRAEAAQQEARGYAMLGGDMALIETRLSEARRLLTEEPSGSAQDSSSLAGHYHAPLLDMQAAICLNEAGQPERAVEIYSESLTRDAFSVRDYGYFRALASIAQANVGRPDDAAAAGRESLQIADATGSIRTIRELSRLQDRLRPWSARPEVRAFGEDLAASLSQIR